MQPVIDIQRLSKQYGQGRKAFTALHDLTLSVHQGEVFGYLGPNGAGKSTTIHILLDIIRPTAGRASIFGRDVSRESVEVHKRVGFMPGELALWRGERASQIIRDFAQLRGNSTPQLRYADELAQRLNLDPSKRIREYSTGNKRKVGLVLALMHKPDLLILDEPTSGLDPLLQHTFNQLMLEAKAEGRTVFLSSHVLSEVQSICDRVGILRGGELQSVENVQGLLANGVRKVVLQVPLEAQAHAAACLEALPNVRDLTNGSATLRFTYVGQMQPLVEQLAHLPVQDLLISEPSLEEVFLAFYGDNEKVN
ncbi:ABC transporter ATP-binding protein [Aggregatilineales bacterium SYSU G02658]